MRRAFDFWASVAGLMALSPVLAVVAVLVRLTSRGPVFFAQNRVGKDGRVFRVVKFRTMVENAESLGTSVTTGRDPRITRLGRVLRRTKLDELPQLVNVALGDMALVGPRPDVPRIIAGYSPAMRRALTIRPGITNLATLCMKDEEMLLNRVPDPDAFYEEWLAPFKVLLALDQVENDSLAYDFRLLAKTVWALGPGRALPLRPPDPRARLFEDNLALFAGDMVENG